MSLKMVYALPASLMLMLPVLLYHRSVSAEELSISLGEATNIAATVSPDGSELIIDVQGVLWRLPVQGGDAQQLTEFGLEPARPEWSPQGDSVAFQAYRAGTFDIWTMAPDGSNLNRLTDGPYDEREPTWSPDGSKIAFASDRDEGYDIWTIDVATGELRQWTSTPSPEEESYPAWSPDGTEIAFVVNNEIQAVDMAGSRRTLVSSPEAGTLRSPAWTPSGDAISYIQTGGGQSDLMLSGESITNGEDVFPFKGEWLSENSVVYTADGKIRVRDVSAGLFNEIPFATTFILDRPEYARKTFAFDSRQPQQVKGIETPALSPDGQSVAFTALNDLWLMEIGKRPRQLTDDTYWEADPAWSYDGARLAYVSDRAGTPDIYIRDMTTGEERRLTSIDGAELHPAWSPDGSRIAFQDQQDLDGATLIVQVDSGEVEQVVDPLFMPGRPTWSVDGQTLALAALQPYSTRFREGTSQILLVDLGTGEQTYIEPAPNRSITTRTADGPVWSPDGTAMAFVLAGRLWVAQVDPSGQFVADPIRVTDEIAESPTWSGDSTSLLYLNNGQLKIVSRNGGTPRPVPLKLKWRPAQPSGRLVIHAGKLWDGRNAAVQRDVDITVIGNRIASIERHRDEAHKGRVIDASGLTVVPGLFDMHVHQEWSNHDYGYGDRQGRLSLTFGITSTQSVGDAVYRATADREALRSGERVGPRFFAGGEPMTGSRNYYNIMRPITSRQQLDLELERARELDYDVVKTYVRLKPSWMGQAAETAHDLGVSVVSHFLSPGVLVGQDGTTHLGATERLDYSRISSLIGRTYEDVIKLFADGGMTVTTTFFLSEPSLFRPGSDITEDRRVRILMPSWEQESLLAAKQIATADPETLPPDVQDTLIRIGDNPATFLEIFKRGGSVLAGTDSPLDFPAIALHSNLRWLENNGWTPFQTLQTTTMRAAEALGVEEHLGSVEEGKLADVIFVEGNPQQDIEDLINVRMVMKNGELFKVKELMAAFPEDRSNGKRVTLDEPSPGQFVIRHSH